MGGGKEGGEKNGKALFKKPSPGALYKDASEWLTSRPGRSCHIPKQSCTHDTWRKRRHGNRGVYTLSRPSTAVCPASRASQNLDPTKSANSRATCQMVDFLRSVARKSTKFKSSLDRGKERIKVTERKVDAIAKKVIDPEYDILRTREIGRKKLSTPSSLKPRSIRGLMMKPCT